MSDDISRVVALAWGVAASPQRGPKRELSHERIVEAAVSIADAEGLAAVTMQRVAESFGFTTMAIYRYFATKDDLQALMMDAALGGELPAIDDTDWRDALGTLCAWLLDAYATHPWTLDIPLAMESLLMPSQLRFADAAMRAMRSLPAALDEKLLLLTNLATYVRGHAVLMRELVGSAAPFGEATKQLIREVVAAGRFPDLAPLIESGAFFGDPPAAPDTGGEWSETDAGIGLQTWFAGIAATFPGDR